jgi:galactokinase
MQTSQIIDLFVPGRVALLGEHSDWAAGHRKSNNQIPKGAAIVVGTNQGTIGYLTKFNLT